MTGLLLASLLRYALHPFAAHRCGPGPPLSSVLPPRRVALPLAVSSAIQLSLPASGTCTIPGPADLLGSRAPNVLRNVLALLSAQYSPQYLCDMVANMRPAPFFAYGD